MGVCNKRVTVNFANGQVAPFVALRAARDYNPASWCTVHCAGLQLRNLMVNDWSESVQMCKEKLLHWWCRLAFEEFVPAYLLWATWMKMCKDTYVACM